MVEQFFIEAAFHQSSFSSNRVFIKGGFHKSGFSSKRVFIKAGFHQSGFSSKQFFIKAGFHQSRFSSKQLFIKPTYKWLSHQMAQLLHSMNGLCFSSNSIIHQMHSKMTSFSLAFQICRQIFTNPSRSKVIKEIR